MTEHFCPRLVDYIILVGSHSTNRVCSSVQIPTILNRFPPCDHKDFVLPPDVALFCQPEGCFNTRGSGRGNNSSPIPVPPRTPISFIFALTDKETSKVRYGICLNFLRPIHRRLSSRKSSNSAGSKGKPFDLSRSMVNGDVSRAHAALLNGTDSFDSGPQTSPPVTKKRLYTHTLTSLCLVSHHPFFTKFRAIVQFLQTLIQKLHERSRPKVPDRETVWGVLTGAIPAVTSPIIVRSVREIELWILRLLSAPAPVPGKTCVHLSVQPKSLMKPLIFALPDKSRLPLVDFPLHLPIQLLGVARTLRILVCLLLEQKVVLQSADYNKLSICVLAFTALLYPLQYMFPVIPLLPPCMADAEQILIAPTPYIIGVPTSFYAVRKVFRMPKDVWVANLDTQELSYPEVLEEFPNLPEPECTSLVGHLNQALSTLPPVDSGPSLDLALSEMNTLVRGSGPNRISGYNPLAFITDEASTAVATRVAMVLFMNSRNILGNMTEHTRTLRLYPRPVVAFQFECFMKSRPKPCLFTSMLARTQAVEYFAELCLCAQNEAYQRILSGEYASELIGDKAEWFHSLLTPVPFDVWPEALAGGPQPTSSIGQSDEITASPLLYALVAARLHLGSTRPVNNVDAQEQTRDRLSYSTERLLGELSLTMAKNEEPSDYPTDESASDTETEHSTASIGSMVSDLTSDHLDSGIGESQGKPTVDIHLDPIKQIGSSESLNGLTNESSVIIRPGEPLPPSLAVYFTPPTEPVLGPCNGILPTQDGKNGGSLIRTTTENEDAERESTLSASSEIINQLQRDPASDSPTPSLSTGQTLRTLTRASVSMFSGSPSSSKTPDASRTSASVISDGRINWEAPFFVLVGELFNAGSSTADDSLKDQKKRMEDERYLIQISKGIKEGSIPGIFSRNRVHSLLGVESNRNLLLSRLNQSGLDEVNQVELGDVLIDRWSQYKALVWILRQIATGLQSSLRSDIVIPLPVSMHMDLNLANIDRTGSGGGSTTSATTATESIPSITVGGLASALALLEVAHTHYYQLPMRPTNPSDRAKGSNPSSERVRSFSQVDPITQSPLFVGSNLMENVNGSIKSNPISANTDPSQWDNVSSSSRPNLIIESLWERQIGLDLEEALSVVRRRVYESSARLTQVATTWYTTSVTPLLYGDSEHSGFLNQDTRKRSVSSASMNPWIPPTESLTPPTRRLSVSSPTTPVLARLTRLPYTNGLTPGNMDYTGIASTGSSPKTGRKQIRQSPDEKLRSPSPRTLPQVDVTATNGRVSMLRTVSTESSTLVAADGVALAPKSACSKGYRYHRSKLYARESNLLLNITDEVLGNRLIYQRHSLDEATTNGDLNGSSLPTTPIASKSRVNRTYVFEDLIVGSSGRSKLWDDHQFWEDAFLDAVAQERDILGMDFRPGELLSRYYAAGPLKRKQVELAEDRLLSALLHNMIAFMIMTGVDRTGIRRKVRRLLAKSHMGLHYSQEIGNLLDVLDYLYGNDINLKSARSHTIPFYSYEVHRGTNTDGELLFIEVGDDCILLRNLAGTVVDRWWYDQVINLTYRLITNILSISIRSTNGQSNLNLFSSKKCQTIYTVIKNAMEQASDQLQHGTLAGDLDGELNVVSLTDDCPGTFKVSVDGFMLKLENRKMFIGIPNIKRCSAPQSDLFVIEYFDTKEKVLQTHRLQTDMALLILNLWRRVLTVAINRRTSFEARYATPVRKH